MDIILKVNGMMCGHCKATVENTLNSFDGVTAAADLDKKEVKITAPDGTDIEQLKKAIISEGYDIIE